MSPRASARESATQRRALSKGPNCATCSVEAGRKLRHPNQARQGRAAAGAILSVSGSSTTVAVLPLIRTAVSTERRCLGDSEFNPPIVISTPDPEGKPTISPRNFTVGGGSTVADGDNPVPVGYPHGPARVLGDE